MNQFAFILFLAFFLHNSYMAEINNFDYSQHGDNWSFEAPNGTDWTQCSSQKQQSPIQIQDDFPQNSSTYLFSNFYSKSATIQWLNTTVYIRTGTSFGEIYTKGITDEMFALKANQVRIRCHSQHKLAGQQYYDLELQIFCLEQYGSPKNIRLAFSLMFEVGPQPDPALAAIQNSYAPGAETSTASLNFAHLINNQNPFDFWYYMGSLTFPPCFSGNLHWIVSKRVFSMSKEQRDFFYNMFNSGKLKGNWRNLQPLKGNPVNFYHFGK